MAGPGIRVWEIGKVLTRDNKAAITIPSDSGLTWPNLTFIKRTYLDVFKAIFDNDIIIFPIYSLDLIMLFVARLLRKKIVIDAYFVPLFENLEKYAHSPKLRDLVVKISKLRTRALLLAADLVLCASERQRGYWLEQLAAFGRIAVNVLLVPTGIRGARPVKKHNLIKGVVPGIFKDDKVVLWASGLWPWLDPQTAIRALEMIKDEKIKLVFFGTKAVDEHFKGEANEPVVQAIRLAREMGLLNKRVFFIEQRVPYDEIADYLLEADVALNLHYDNLETRYAYRTRLLDYIWAGIPIVTTKGDVLSEEILKHGLGLVIDPGDTNGASQAINKLLNDQVWRGQSRQAMADYAKKITWDKVSEPLCRYIARPQVAKDNKRFLNTGRICLGLSAFYGLSLLFLAAKKFSQS